MRAHTQQRLPQEETRAFVYSLVCHYHHKCSVLFQTKKNVHPVFVCLFVFVFFFHFAAFEKGAKFCSSSGFASNETFGLATPLLAINQVRTKVKLPLICHPTGMYHPLLMCCPPTEHATPLHCPPPHTHRCANAWWCQGSEVSTLAFGGYFLCSISWFRLQNLGFVPCSVSVDHSWASLPNTTTT